MKYLFIYIAKPVLLIVYAVMATIIMGIGGILLFLWDFNTDIRFTETEWNSPSLYSPTLPENENKTKTWKSIFHCIWNVK